MSKESRTSRTAAEQAFAGRQVTNRTFAALKRKAELTESDAADPTGEYGCFYDFNKITKHIGTDSHTRRKITRFMGWLRFNGRGELILVDERTPIHQVFLKTNGIWKLAPHLHGF